MVSGARLRHHWDIALKPTQIQYLLLSLWGLNFETYRGPRSMHSLPGLSLKLLLELPKYLWRLS